MKKLVLAFLLVVLLLSLTVSVVLAGDDMEDPALCVAGKWLLVDKAYPNAVQVVVPEDVPYGNQQQGGCATPGPTNVPIIKVVRERSRGNVMLVRVDGAGASTPKVTASYGSDIQTKKNNGHQVLNFVFRLR
jgi:hypothetical protein